MQNIVETQNEETADVVRILKAEDEALLKEPSRKLCPDFKKLRQAYYKEKYHQKKETDGTQLT